MDHSKNYWKVKRYFERGFWSKHRVYNVVGRWITAEEYKEITGEDYVAE